MTFYIHKYGIQQEYGGPEEGGWWYDRRWVIEDWTPQAYEDEQWAYGVCRALNEEEYERQKKLEYGYTSVLSYKEDFYTYTVEDSPIPAEETTSRPHYE